MRSLSRAIAVVILTAFFTVGCATVFTGTSDTVTIKSEPSGAKIYLNGNYEGDTPTSLILKRDKDYNVMLKKAGFENTSATITRSFNAVSILNLLSPLCWIVDVVTGALWKFDRNTITVTLEKINLAAHSIIPGRIAAAKDMVIDAYNGKTGIFIKQEAHAK